MACTAAAANASGSRAARCLVAVALLFVAACNVPNSKIEGEDNSAWMGSTRLSFELLRRPERITFEPPPNDFHLVLDFDFSSAEGDFTQRVVPPDVISVGGPQLTGNVDVDFELDRAYIAVRAVNHFRNGIGLDGFVGISDSDLDIQLSQGAVSDRADYDAAGPLLGGKFYFAPLEWLCFFVEGSLAFGFSGDVETSEILTFDAGTQFTFGNHFGLSAGWRRMSYEADLDDFVASDLDLVLSGPMLTLLLGF